MADIMTFPKNWNDFVEQYKIVDTEQVYTNGSDLMPVFRFEQWIVHAIPEPVSHGRWKRIKSNTGNPKYDFIRCSECGAEALLDVDWYCLSDYCPHCGARMDGE